MRTDASLKIKDHQSLVLYDASTGRIVSVYHSLVYEGADPGPNQQDMESRAIESTRKFVEGATRQSFNVSDLKLLKSRPEIFDTPGPKKVDLKRQMVVPAEN